MQTELPHRLSLARFLFYYYTDRITWPLIIGEIFLPSLNRQNNLADNHRRDFCTIIIQTVLPRHWSSARFSCPLYTVRTTRPLIIGKIFVAFFYTDRTALLLIIGKIFVTCLYRQNYLAADHREFLGFSLYRQKYHAADHGQDFRAIFIHTEVPHCWSSARVSCHFCTDRITTPLIISEIFVPSIYSQKYLTADHRLDFRPLFIQSELTHCWSSARFSCPLFIQTELLCRWPLARFLWLAYTDRSTMPLIIGSFWVLYTDRIALPLIIGEIFVRYLSKNKLLHIQTLT